MAKKRKSWLRIEPGTFASGRREKQKNNTRDSNVVPHRSTNLARQCLTSLSRREAVLSLWYGRSWTYTTFLHIYTLTLTLTLTLTCTTHHYLPLGTVHPIHTSTIQLHYYTYNPFQTTQLQHVYNKQHTSFSYRIAGIGTPDVVFLCCLPRTSSIPVWHFQINIYLSHQTYSHLSLSNCNNGYFCQSYCQSLSVHSVWDKHKFETHSTKAIATHPSDN